jgi:hypothetical protein
LFGINIDPIGLIEPIYKEGSATLYPHFKKKFIFFIFFSNFFGDPPITIVEAVVKEQKASRSFKKDI